jgi:YHS domain-containing protein
MLMNISLRTLCFVLTGLFVCLATPSLAEAKSEINKNWRGIAIKGYDPVAFHSEGRPVKGVSQYVHTWKDAKWRFANAENKELFKANPDAYAPKYGGYCAWAVSEGYTASVDPEKAWNIVDGRLYLNYSVEIKQKWEKDIPGHIRKADANWPSVLK